MDQQIITDARGVEVYVRSGTGVVLDVQPTGKPRGDGSYATQMVTLSVDSPPNAGAATTYRATPIVGTDSHVRSAATLARRAGYRVRWRIEWRRTPGVDDSLPIGLLDLTTEAQAVLVELAPIPSSHADDRSQVPDYFPESWTLPSQ